jgi:hypothetical protein
MTNCQVYMTTNIFKLTIQSLCQNMRILLNTNKGLIRDIIINSVVSQSCCFMLNMFDIYHD